MDVLGQCVKTPYAHVRCAVYNHIATHIGLKYSIMLSI